MIYSFHVQQHGYMCTYIYIYIYVYIYMDACTETLTHMLPPMHEPTFSFPESTWHKCCSIHHMLLLSMLMKALMSSLPGMSPMSGWAAVYWASNQLRQMAPISSDVWYGPHMARMSSWVCNAWTMKVRSLSPPACQYANHATGMCPGGSGPVL